MDTHNTLTKQDEIDMLEARIEADQKHLKALKEMEALRHRLKLDGKRTPALDAEIRDIRKAIGS